MQQGLVSVLLTSYNRPRYLRGAILSVIQQSYDNWELWILDDNSNMETLDVIYQLRHDYPTKIIYYHNSEIEEAQRHTTGCRYAQLINYGLEFCNGEFVTYLTDDDFYYPDRLKDMVHYLRLHCEQSVVYGDQQKIDVDSNGMETIADVRLSRNISDSPQFNVDHNSVMHRMSCVEKVGKWPIDDWRAGDAQYWIKLVKAGYLFYPLGKVMDAKRYHPYTLSAKIDRGEDFIKARNE